MQLVVSKKLRLFIISTYDLEPRKTPAIVYNLIWSPFDTRFKDLLEQMAHHRSLVSYELHIMHAQAVNDAFMISKQEKLYAAEERLLVSKERKRAERDSKIIEEIKHGLEGKHNSLSFLLSFMRHLLKCT